VFKRLCAALYALEAGNRCEFAHMPVKSVLLRRAGVHKFRGA
jgi:hypothetical protein